MNEAATFVGAASIAAGCPNILDPFPPPLLVGPLADPRCGNDAQALGEFRNGGTYPASSTLENRGASLVASWKVNDMLSLKSITSDRRLEWTGTRDADNTPLLILHTNYRSESKQFSQELQAVVDADRLDGVIGLYYFDEDSFDRLLVPLGNPGTSYDTQRVAMDTEAKAAFTEWTFKFTDAFSATAGIRYTKENKGLQATMFNVAPATATEPAAPTALCPFAGAPPTQTGCLFLTTNRFARDFSATTKSASVQYRFNERRDDLSELVGRLQERRLQPALQRRAAGQRADLVRRGNRRNHSRSASSWIRSIRCASTRRVQHGLRRHPDDLPPGRRAVAVQRRCRVHRRRRARAGIRAHRRLQARCDARISRCEVRQHHGAAAVWSGLADRDGDPVQPAAVHAGVARPPRAVVHLPSGSTGR